MATLKIDSFSINSDNSFTMTVSVTGLQPSYEGYRRVKIELANQFTVYKPDSNGRIDNNNWRIDYSNEYSLSAGSYTVTATLENKNPDGKGGYGEWQATSLTDSKNFTISAQRPAKFYWSTGHPTSRQPFNILAQDWLNLQRNINAVRVYKGLSEYSSFSFNDWTTNKEFKHEYYNEARQAIQQIPGYGTHIPGPFDRGDIIYASYLDDRDSAQGSLVSELNAIP